MSAKVHLLATVYRYADLVPHWIAHYQSLGISRIHLLVNERGLAAASRPILAAHAGFIRHRYSAEYTSAQRTAQEMEWKNRCLAANDFYACVDLDEFHEYPLPLPELLARLQSERAHYLAGNMLDHVTRDGSLPGIGPQSLWDQFPLEGPLTAQLVRGNPRCIMLCRRSVNLERGRHQARGRPCSLTGTVHHFKWHATVVPLLQDRCRIMQSTGNPFLHESQRVLNQIDSRGHLNLDGLPLQPNRYRPPGDQAG
jgi:hypothetical protein